MMVSIFKRRDHLNMIAGKNCRKECGILLFVLLFSTLFLHTALAADTYTFYVETDAGLIAEGDRILIVNAGSSNIVSDQAVGSMGQTLAGSIASIAQDAEGRGVIRSSSLGNGAVFTVESAGDGKIYLKSDKGYLTSVESGGGVYMSEEKAACSLWQIKDGVYLHNVNAVNGTWKNYYLELHYGNFTTYGKNSKSDPAQFALSFYRETQSDTDPVPVDDDKYVLNIFHTTDVHGYLAEITSAGDEYRLAYISDKVNDLRTRIADPDYNKSTLLLDSGDIYQGNNLSNMNRGKTISHAFDIMGYDAVTIGNHEFDWGIENTVDADGTMMDYDGHENKVPVVISNLYRNGKKVDFAQDYLICEKNAWKGTAQDGSKETVKIGVIGFAEEYSDSIMTSMFTDQGYSISEDYEALDALAKDLEENKGCDATVVIAHGDGQVVARQLPEGTCVDLVLGGHTHINSMGRGANGVLYVQPGCYGQAYAYCGMAFKKTDAGDMEYDGMKFYEVLPITDDKEHLYYTDSNKNENDLDQELAEFTKVVLDEIKEKLSEVIGYITTPAPMNVYIPDSGNRSSAIGNWMASIYASSVSADIGFMNGGGIRVGFDIEAGRDRREITLGDVHTMFPFENEIYCYELTWEEFKTLVDYSLTSGGRGLLTDIVGVDCYFTGEGLDALVYGDTVIYAHGVWKKDWKEKTVRVAASSFSATTDRPTDGFSNPLVAWAATDRLVSSDITDIDGALRVLRAQAAGNDSVLHIDDKAHFIEKSFSGEVTDAPSSDENEPGNEPANEPGNEPANEPGNESGVSDYEIAGGYASPEDNFAADTASGRIDSMVLDFSKAEGRDPGSLKMTVIKGSRLITAAKLMDRHSATATGGIKVKVNKKDLTAKITCKKDGSATFTMEDGKTYTINFRVQRPAAQKAAKLINKGSAVTLRTVKDMFGTDICSGKLSVVKQKASQAYVSGNSIVVEPREKDSIMVLYKYLNKKFRITIKVR